MLDNLFSSMSGDVMNDLTSQTGISMDQAKEMMPMAQESIQSGMMEQVTSGNVSGLTSMLSSSGDDLQNNSIFSGIKQKFMGMIMSKMGMPESTAGMVAGMGMTSMMGKISGACANEDGTMDKSGVMNLLGIGGTGGMMDSVSGAAKDKLGDITGGLF